jgi:diketogulonate reductase-like aldo/keto reductase
LQRPSISTVIFGARNEEQLRQNLGAVGWNLSSKQVAKLDAASDVTPVYPYWHQRQFEERNPMAVPLVEKTLASLALSGLTDGKAKRWHAYS